MNQLELHDLRDKVGTILMCIEVLKMDTLPKDKMEKAIEFIRENAVNALKLVEGADGNKE